MDFFSSLQSEEMIPLPIVMVLLSLLLLSFILLIIVIIQKENLKKEIASSPPLTSETGSDEEHHFIASISHDIRTPMNAILGFSEILKSREKDPQNQNYLELIHTSALTLFSHVNDLLDLSQIKAGRIGLHKTVISLQELVKDLEALFAHKVRGNNIDFLLLADKTLPDTLLMDEMRTKQVLINLLANAIKFTTEGFIHLTITGKPSSKNPLSHIDLTFALSDSGVGIQKENLIHLFEEEDAHKNNPLGTGIGLLTTKRIIEMMGGSISVSSKPQKGTTFLITLPSIEIIPNEPDAIKRDFDFKASSILFKPATILIADDVQSNQKLLALYLKEWNFTTLFANNGKEAVEIAQKEKPNIILMDMKMSIMDGYEASEILREKSNTKEIPIIAITGTTQKEDITLIKRVCSSYLSKPVNKNALIWELTKFLPFTTLSKEDSMIEEEFFDTTIIPPSMKDMEVLYNLAMIGDMEDIYQFSSTLKEKDRRHSLFADKIMSLAQSCQDREILRIIEKYWKE